MSQHGEPTAAAGSAAADPSRRVLDELVAHLALERIEQNLYRGQSLDLGWGRVFGGQVLGQALGAALRTVPKERAVHSLQAYFLRPGRVDMPIVYNVDRIRDGSSFTTRRVIAIQNGEAIFNLAASFQVAEPGFEHSDEMPSVAGPDGLPTEQEHAAPYVQRLPVAVRDRVLAERAFEMRPVEPPGDPFDPPRRAPKRHVWLRTVERLPDDPALHCSMLAYASDFSFMTTALQPHGVSWVSPGMQVASLDHVMWFHRPFRVDEWLLYAIESPAAHGARGLARGRVFTQSGTLVVTVAQEGLMRQRPVKPA
jgi:acyl-CoA thioesterase-2